MAAVARNRWVAFLMRTERALEHRVAKVLRDRRRWQVTVVPYVAHGTSTRCHVRGRVLVRRREPSQRASPLGTLLLAVSRYASVEVPDERVVVEVADRSYALVSGPEGYLEATVELPGLSPGWHPVYYRLGGPDPVASPVTGQLLVVGPDARLGIVSDLDDTVIQTGLTRLVDALRTTLLVADANRVAVRGAADLYRELVAADDGRAPVCYVSAGAWNLHAMLVGFLERGGFPAGPLLLTDWGPTAQWAFREDSVAFKTRTILALFTEHAHLSWLLVGDSGQDDAETYAAVVRAHPHRVRAVYIRDVPPTSNRRTALVNELAAEVQSLGVPMLLIRDSVEAAEHARSLGLLDADAVRRVRLGR